MRFLYFLLLNDFLIDYLILELLIFQEKLRKAICIKENGLFSFSNRKKYF